jgi:hypothetical protein
MLVNKIESNFERKKMMSLFKYRKRNSRNILLFKHAYFNMILLNNKS